MENQELVTKENSVITDQSISQPERLLEMAMAQGADLAQLEKFMDLKDRHDKNEARKAFTRALSNFKSEGVSIHKDKEVSYSTTFYTHASLGNIISTATPILSKYGLSHRWETNQSDGVITVKCILTHFDGHYESTSLQSGADVTGGKNAIQAIASTITYLERYTFLAITGLAVKDQLDDDGASYQVEFITPDQELVLNDLINEVKADKDGFLKYLKVDSIGKLPTTKYDQAVKALEAKRK